MLALLSLLHQTVAHLGKMDLYSEHKFTFTSYDEARHFFNSGGEFIVDMSSTAGGTNSPSITWKHIL